MNKERLTLVFSLTLFSVATAVFAEVLYLTYSLPDKFIVSWGSPHQILITIPVSIAFGALLIAFCKPLKYKFYIIIMLGFAFLSLFILFRIAQLYIEAAIPLSA